MGSSDLLELWIVTNTGLTMFTWRPESIQETIDPNLFSGFMTAILSMVASTEDQDIEAINFGSSKLEIQVLRKNVKQPVLFIGRARAKEKAKNVKKTLRKIQEEFLDAYGDALSTWDGNQSLFQAFEKKIRDYFVS